MEEPNTVLCDEELGIANAQDFSQTLHDAFLTGKATIVDLSKTQRIDTTIAQLICLFNRDAQEQSRDFEWRYSDAVADTLRILGLKNHLHAYESCSSVENNNDGEK
ncbi:MAG: STAS domain-containing protein [Gammaproteobacteria bacterium]|nr:STAS domain-containing protein [Gammaproteobacteria bacterium]